MKKVFTTFFATAVVASAFALTPDEAAVKATLDGIEKAATEGKLMTAVFEAMPASHQKGLFDVSQAFATKMDPMVWNSGTSILGNIGKVFSTKADFIVNGVFAKEALDDTNIKNEDVNESFVLAGTAISNIASITLADIKAQQSPKALAAFFDSKIGKLPVSKDAEPGYTIKTEEDGDIVVCFRGSKCGDDGVEFKKVNGKWIPEEIAELEFDEMINGINEGIDFSSEEGQQIKMQAVMGAAMFNGMLAPALQATTQEEFDVAIQSILAPFIGGGTAPVAPEHPAVPTIPSVPKF